MGILLYWGFFSTIEGTLVPLKASSDLEVGAGWRRPHGELARNWGPSGAGRWEKAAHSDASVM